MQYMLKNDKTTQKACNKIFVSIITIYAAKTNTVKLSHARFEMWRKLKAFCSMLLNGTIHLFSQYISIVILTSEYPYKQ